MPESNCVSASCHCIFPPALNISVDQGSTPLLAGTSRSLSCSICSPVASANFTWMENGSPVNTSDSRIILNSTANTSTLQFNPLLTSDGGQYQCVATLISVDNFVDLTDQIDLNVTSKWKHLLVYIMYAVQVYMCRSAHSAFVLVVCKAKLLSQYNQLRLGLPSYSLNALMLALCL